MKQVKVRGRKPITDKVCIGVYITSEVHEKAVELAAAKELTLSDIFRAALKEYLSKECGE